jgi:hypothetical protein
MKTILSMFLTVSAFVLMACEFKAIYSNSWTGPVVASALITIAGVVALLCTKERPTSSALRPSARS